ncbi:HET-domain-containing protein, partial [Hyaloscypha variabilis F]
MASAPNPSTASSTAVYVPLADASEIRLLYLQPGCGNETIKCSLQNTELPNSPPYEALSYMWGPKVYKTIVLDGKPFSVTENLWQALIHLRRENDSRTLWVDAVCINQKDTSERNHQVMQMGIVYSQAWRVLAWLGLADDDSRLAFHVCASYLVNKLPAPCDFLLSLTLSGAELKAIQSLCSRAYWSRLWIIQELLLA